MNELRIGHLPLAVMENRRVSVRVCVCVCVHVHACLCVFQSFFLKMRFRLNCLFYLSIRQTVNTSCLSAKQKMDKITTAQSRS